MQKMASLAMFLASMTLVEGAISSLAATVAAPSESTLESWVDQAGVGLDPRALDALHRIDHADRRLLAVRAYLRVGAALAEHWSWSAEELAAYPASPEGQAAAAQLDAVMQAFAAANPGFTLHINREPRSLDLQITHWNENESVGTTAAELAGSMQIRLARFARSDATHSADINAVREALIAWQPTTAAALAAPGLSAHGQARAFDFQIERDGRIIAGTEFATATQRWDAAGWTEKLHAAVAAAGGHFAGPLASPYEPWHYSYLPALAPAPAASYGPARSATTPDPAVH